MKPTYLAALLILALPACSDGGTDSSPQTPEADAAAEAAQNEADGDTGAEADSAAEAQVEAEAGPPGSLDEVVGIWAKRTTGDAMIVENTCGNFYMIDFDFKHTRFSKAGPTTLKVEYCSDATCQTVEQGVDKTLEFAGGAAKFSKTEPMKLGASCELTIVEDGTITFETADYGRFSWKNRLTYKGTGCAQYKDAKMTGDTCDAIAESEIDRVQ